jgi:hypothetical protein
VLKSSLLTRLAPPLAAAKLAAGLAAFLITYADAAGQDPTFPYLYYGLFATAFGATAALLLIAGRGDRRAAALGGFFLVTATSWCNKPLRLLSPSHDLFALVDALEMDAFMPFFLWSFVRDFPGHAPTLSGRRRLQVAVRIAGAAGLLLFALNLLLFVRRLSFDPSPALGAFAPRRGEGIFYGVVLPLTAAALCYLPWKARFALPSERQRLSLFLKVLTVTFGPGIAFTLLHLFIAPFRDFVDARPALLRTVIACMLLPALTLPVTVPYTVLVQRVLDVRLIALQGLKYVLARSTARALMAGPMIALVFYLYGHRGESLRDLVSGGRVALLLSAILIGAAALRYSRRILDLVDRRFFREQYDARRILTLLVERIRSIQEPTALADLVSREIDLALHLEGIAMLVLDPRSGMLADPRHRSRKLDTSSALALTLANASDPLEVDLGNPRSALSKLPENERHWLVDSGFQLMVPILARDGSLLGLVGLGGKKSGLPFLSEDRRLLHAIASSAAWVLELEQGRVLPPQQRSFRDPLAPEDAAPSELSLSHAEVAKECPKCGALHPSFTVFCRACSHRLGPANVPFVVPGKFRFEQRVGVGGMGIVYSGADLALGRRVAIKTLRRVSPEDAMRLRREARTAAAVSHPHLAPIYGMETWRGTPLLVLELLEGGTLAHRIAQGKLSPRETVELGIAMAGALAQLHAAEVLHRDIKPSNIGYTRDGLPKLMDFGIARVMFELRREELDELEEDDDLELLPAAAVWNEPAGPGLPPRLRFVGTLSYLSPEALQRQPADASFDLWSLSVVLYECLLGRKVFAGTDQQVMERIRAGRVPDFSQVCPEHDEGLGELFRQALHPSLAQRPASACELRRRLEEVRARL